MINIHNSYSVHIGSSQSNLSYSVHLVLFSLFCPLKFYAVQLGLFGFIQCYLVHSVHIGSIWSTLVLFCSLRFYLVHSIHFGCIWSIMSTLVLFCPISLHIGLIRPILSSLIHFSPIQAFQSTLVLFGPFCNSYLIQCKEWNLNALSFELPVSIIDRLKSHSCLDLWKQGGHFKLESILRW